MKRILTVAVVGNPNVGKTALINTLAGSHLKIGNWPGVTVEKKEALLSYKGVHLKLIDLPGVYGLGSLTQDEIITSNYLYTKSYDMIINVIDTHNLQLNMYLTSQLLELKKPTLIALNFYSEFKKSGNTFMFEECAKQLNVDMLPIEANQKREKKTLLDACVSLLKSQKIPKPFEKLNSNQGRQEIVKSNIDKVLHLRQKTYTTATDKLDRLLLHPLFGLISFFAIFYFIFKWTYDGSSPFIDWIDGFFNVFLRKIAESILTFLNAPPVIQSFIYDGLIAGIGTVMTFVPLMAFLYFFISILEESGYIARVAFLLDKYMMAIGLPGKAFIPLLIGFGCNVPGVYATRTLEDTHDKKIVAIIISFISCGAKLPIYVLFSTIFFPRYAGQVAVALYFLGIVTAVAWAVVLKKWIYTNKTDSLIIELPEYRFPTLQVLWNSVRLKVKSFVKRAGTIITAVVILVWALTNLPYGVTPDRSILATVSKSVSPLFLPLGWGNSWRATAAVVPGFLAKEAVVGALMTTYNVQEHKKQEKKTTLIQDILDQITSFKDATLLSGKMMLSGIIPGVFKWENNEKPLVSALGNDFTPLTAFSFMVFNLLLMSCTAVMGAVRQEFGAKFLITALLITGGTAYMISLFVYQLGRFMGF